MTNKKRDGSFYTENATISPVFDPAGEIINFVAVKRDITDELRMKIKLQQSQKMEAIGTLAGGIAHDFNNILFPIVGHAEMLLEDIHDDSPLKDGIQQIYNGALRSRSLVQNILDFSRQGENEIALIKMQPIIEEALTFIRSTISTSIAIHPSLSSECGAIKADPTRIHQIVMNLATNAYHAMAENGGSLSVSLKEIELDEQDLITPDMIPGAYACLVVADTGTGIDEEIMPRIFDPFFTTKEKEKGTGMGLSVVYGIIKSMKGAIQVYSKPGKGSEFRVYLPVCRETPVKQTTRTNDPAQGVTGHILLVDDEAAIIAMEKQMLNRLGNVRIFRYCSVPDSVTPSLKN